MIFDITIARQEGVDYEPVIVNAIKENQDSIVDNIRKSNPKIQGSFDVCIQPRNGNGDAVCSLDGKETSSPTKLPISKPAPTPARPLKSNAEVEESNFPIWIIIVIVICLLFIICCVCGFVFYRRSHGEKGKNTDADKVMKAATQPAEDDSDDDDSSSEDEQYTAKSRGMSTRRSTMPPQQQYMPVPPNLGMLAIHENQPFDQSQRVLALPNDPHQGSTVFVDDDISTLPDQSLRDIDAYTYAESATRPDPTMYSSRSKNKSKRNLNDPSVYTRRTTKDPSFYLENGSVADASGFIGGYSQYSKNDPSMYQGSVMSSVRGVQDPSVYYYGNNAQDPSVYRSGLNVEDPSVYYSGNNARDPSIYHGTSAAFDDPSYNPSSFRFPRAQEAMSMMSENSYSIYGKTDYSNTQSSMATDNKSRSGKKSKKSKKKKEQNRSKPLASIDS